MCSNVTRRGLEGWLHAGRDLRSRARGQSDILDQYAADYPQGPHDKPQSMCPAFGSLRVGLRMKRDGDDPVRLGLLCLWADLRVAFLRRAAVGRLCAVQFGNPGHRQAVRGHPRGGARHRRSRKAGRDRGDEPLRADRFGRAVAAAAGSRSTACGSWASTCPVSACPPTPRPRMCWPVRC